MAETLDAEDRCTVCGEPVVSMAVGGWTHVFGKPDHTAQRQRKDAP